MDHLLYCKYSMYHPCLLISDSVLEFFIDVTIPLGKLVTNDSLGTTVKFLIENVLDYEIPLDKVCIITQQFSKQYYANK